MGQGDTILICSPQAFHSFPNTTHEMFNITFHTTVAVTTKLALPMPPKPILPVETGAQAQQEEQSSGMTIFFSLLVLGECAFCPSLLIIFESVLERVKQDIG
uniref:Sodium/hydrogen exchanger 8 n=1 Tax=Sphaerodactylus townsendi TaxID=933632 RepID=A0ACB8F6D7_9SAUR